MTTQVFKIKAKKLLNFIGDEFGMTGTVMLQDGGWYFRAVGVPVESATFIGFTDDSMSELAKRAARALDAPINPKTEFPDGDIPEECHLQEFGECD